MRLLHLQVAHFGAIERAEVELGPGLNILYGPNDLGKSTLAGALRAALLLPHGSSAARRFAPWHSDRTPRVTLAFEVDGRTWRVSKTWGRGSSGSSLLEWSNDGTTFALEEKGRGVDGKLRDLLGWGIPGPGGKGGKQGLPSSFLATVLLGEQATPYGVLDESLLEDGTERGRERLTEAMAALAQDPLFKAVLDAAQTRVDEAFTATGKRKRAKGSPLVRIADRIQQRQAEYEQLRGRMDEAQAVAARLAELDHRRDRLMSACADARARVDGLERDLERTARRKHVETLLDAVRGRLHSLRKTAAEAERLRCEQRELDAAIPSADERVRVSTRLREDAETELHVARQRLSSLTGDEGPASPEQQEHERRKLELEARQRSTQARLEAAQRAIAIQMEIEDLDRRLEQTEAELRAARLEQERIAARRNEAEAQRQRLAEGVSLRRLEEAQQALAELEANRRRADEQRARAEALRAEASACMLEGDHQLPDADGLQRLTDLWDAARLAEAALGGGLSVEVELHRAAPLCASIDGGPFQDTGDARVFDLERRAEIHIGDVATVRVTGGDAERRRDAEHARRSFAEAAQPVLSAARVDGLAELREQVHEANRRRGEARRLHDEAEGLARLAQAADARDEELELARARVEERRAALGDVDRAILVATIGNAEESSLVEAEAGKAREAAEHGSRLQEHDRRGAQLRAQAEMAAERRVELAARLAGQASELGGAARVVGARAEAELREVQAQLGAIAAEIERVSEARADRVAQAEAALESAEKEVDRAREQEQAARAGAADLRQKRSAAAAALEVRTEQLRDQDDAAELEQVHRIEAELEALPVPEQEVDQALVDDARAALIDHERALEEVHVEVRKAEGALQQVGGEVVREKAGAAREALDAARRDAAELELDYDAWRLLVETLREAENAQGCNLGRVLGSAVSERFARLTQGRYGELAVGPDLKTRGLEAGGDLRSIESLSEGLKEQLATLLRISVAEQLSCALVLDDHLTQTDPARIGWFRDLLRTAAADVQLVVLTCRPTDYLLPEDLASARNPIRDDPSGRLRAVDLQRVIQRAGGTQ